MITKDIVETLAVQSGAVVGVTYITDTDHDMTHFTPSELLAFANAIAAYQREHSASISAFEQAALQKEVAELRKQVAKADGGMRLAEQLVLHDPDNGVYGDCYRATLATLLGLDTEQVPHFLHDNCDVLTFNTRVSEFLSQFGLVYMSVPAWDIPQWKKATGVTIPLYHEIVDASPRFGGIGHAVVGCDGEVFHDPHPTKLGLPRVTEERTIGFLVQASPNAKDKLIAELHASRALEQAKLQEEVEELRKQLASHEALLAEETKQHECWLFNAQALQKSYNELDKKHREEVEVLNLRVAQTTAALVTTNELLHNLAVLATHEANKQGE